LDMINKSIGSESDRNGNRIKRNIEKPGISNEAIEGNCDYDDFLMLLTTILSNMKPTRLIEFNVFRSEINYFTERLLSLVNYRSNSEVLFYQIALSVQQLQGCRFDGVTDETLGAFLSADRLFSQNKEYLNKKYLHVYFTLFESLIDSQENWNVSYSSLSEGSSSIAFLIQTITELANRIEKALDIGNEENKSKNNDNDSQSSCHNQPLLVSIAESKKQRTIMFLLYRYTCALVNLLSKLKSQTGQDCFSLKGFYSSIENLTSVLLLPLRGKEKGSPQNNESINLENTLSSSKPVINSPFYNKTLINLIDVYLSVNSKTVIEIDFTKRIYHEITSQEVLFFLLNSKFERLKIDSSIVLESVINKSFFHSNNGYFQGEKCFDVRLNHEVINIILEKLSFFIDKVNNESDCLQNKGNLEGEGTEKDKVLGLVNVLLDLSEETVKCLRLSGVNQNKLRLKDHTHIILQPQILKTVIYSLVMILRDYYSNSTNSSFSVCNLRLVRLIVKNISSDNEDYIRTHAFLALENLVYNLVYHYHSDYIQNLITAKAKEERDLVSEIVYSFVLVLNDENPDIRSSSCSLLNILNQRYGFIADSYLSSAPDLQSLHNKDSSRLITPDLFISSFEYSNVALLRSLVGENRINNNRELVLRLIQRNLYLDECSELSKKNSHKIFYKEPDNRFIDVIQQKWVLLSGLSKYFSADIHRKELEEWFCDAKSKEKLLEQRESIERDCSIFLLQENFAQLFSENVEAVIDSLLSQEKEEGLNRRVSILKSLVYQSYIVEQ